VKPAMKRKSKKMCLRNIKIFTLFLSGKKKSQYTGMPAYWLMISCSLQGATPQFTGQAKIACYLYITIKKIKKQIKIKKTACN